MPFVIGACGLSPLGLFYPAEFAAQEIPPAILADLVDPTTHELMSLTESDEPVNAQVKIALSRVRASGLSVTQIGQRFGDVRKLDENAEATLKNEAALAVGPLVERGLVKVETVAITLGPDWFEVTLRWRNLRTLKTVLTRVAHPIGAGAEAP